MLHFGSGVTVIVTLLILLTGVAQPASAQQTRDIAPPVREKAWEVSSALLSTLKTTLIHQMAQGIPAAASVCADTAQALTASLGKQHGVQLRRISLKTRNPANTPSSQERTYLKQLEAMLARGVLTDSTVLWHTFSRNGEHYVQMIRPIVLSNPLCLQCHGSARDISQETAAFLRQRYPHDHAKGYKVGMLRGAVSVIVQQAP